MQIGQVPIQFVPERIVSSTDAITLEPERADLLVPSLAPFMPEPVAVVAEAPTNWGLWATLGGLTLFAWLMMSPRRR